MFIRPYSTYTNGRLSGINFSDSLESLHLAAKASKRVMFFSAQPTFPATFPPHEFKCQLILHHYIQYCEYIKCDSNPQGPHLGDL